LRESKNGDELIKLVLNGEESPVTDRIKNVVTEVHKALHEVIKYQQWAHLNTSYFLEKGNMTNRMQIDLTIGEMKGLTNF
jgi:hypothetical protein